MIAPELWLNGRRLTGLAADRAPALGGLKLTWGDPDTEEQAPPETLRFSVLFRDGMHDLPDLHNGATVELLHPEPAGDGSCRNIFTGTVTTMDAEPSEDLAGALVVNATAVGQTADLDRLFTAANLPAGTGRPAQLRALFAAEGWALELPDDPRPSAAARYNSIKLSTLLDRHLTRYRGRRYDLSCRDRDGQLQRRLGVTEGSARWAPADDLLASPVGVWDRSYSSPVRDGQPSPLAVIPAGNVLREVGWAQQPGNTITAVNLTPLLQGDDGFTEDGEERNYRAAPAVVARFGLYDVDIDTDLLQPADQDATAAAWMNDDSPWKPDELKIRDAAALPPALLADLLDPASRNRVLVALDGVMHNRPDPGPSVIRAYLIAGEYTWTGGKKNRWELQLSLDRTIYARPAGSISFEQVRQSLDSDIHGARFDTVGPALSFADFRELEALQPAAGDLWTVADLALLPRYDSFLTVNPYLTFADFGTILRNPA